MPKERESEVLRHLGGKALHQMHSSCVKKMATTHPKEASEFDVLSDLLDLSDKADKLAAKKLPEDPGLSEWFDAIRKTMENLRDCKSIKDIQHPPSIMTFIGKVKEAKGASIILDKTPVLKITTAAKCVTPGTKLVTPYSKPATSDSQMVTPSTANRKNAHPFTLLHKSTNQEVHSKENSLKNNTKPFSILLTPLLNRTFDKGNTTVILDSGSATNSNQGSNALSSRNDSCAIVKSVSKMKENESVSHGMLTRSGSKRKSSETKNKSSKKQKLDSLNISSATLNKPTKSRHPLRDLKASMLASDNKSKLSAVIKPPVQQKQSIISKEQHILEELKKKEKKREENMQRLKAERQQKAEQTKKNREEKRTKTLQKRLQMEKEKEEKLGIEAKKSQVVKVNKENPKKTTRTKELAEPQVKEKKTSLIINSTTQSNSNTEVLVKTPVNRKSEDIDSYELTPVPDSSTYNFSDDEDDRPTSKRVPLWALGMNLKTALMNQYYYPVDTDEVFGSIIETPNLVEIFKVAKKRYLKRTSSAIWNSSPNRSHL